MKFESTWGGACGWWVGVVASGVLWAQDAALAVAGGVDQGRGADAPSVRVEYGVHPDRFGFKLILEGGEAFASGVLRVEDEHGGRAACVPIRLDGDGRFERVWRDVPLARAVWTQFAFAGGGKSLTNKVRVGPASAAARALRPRADTAGKQGDAENGRCFHVTW
jgi:hypothetical protein